MTRRWSGSWARTATAAADSAQLDVLIPTRERSAELAVTLSGLAAQEEPDFTVIVADQSPGKPSWDHPAVRSMIHVLQAQGRTVRLERNLPPQGLAQQRQFLLDRAAAPLVLFLDNDVWLEPDMLRRLTEAITRAGCGFVGAAVQGLSYLPDVRPHEQERFELWSGPVLPERVRHGTRGAARWPLHNAANLAHIASGLEIEPGSWELYKVAWVGACVLFDRRKLVDCGGFGFWPDLPPAHAGEDVAAQWRVMEKYGGAGLVPSGAVHLESPTTVSDRSIDAAGLVFGQ